MANLNNFQEQLDILSATKTSIKEAIIGKGQEVSSEDSFSSYANKIDGIVTLDEGTADANATSNDIVINKTAYVNGEKITGILSETKDSQFSGPSITQEEIMRDGVSNIDDTNGFIGFRTINPGRFITDNNIIRVTVDKQVITTKYGIVSDKIKQGETILGITGNVIELNGETKTITPTTSQQVITPSQDKNAITEVTVNAVTSAIDSNIQAENIKNGVTILGITGTAQTIKTYATQQDMEQALNDGEIESGDFVLCEDIYNFYIAETNAETGDTDLIRLIKEYATITPEEYTENVDIADDILGTE